ncbi:MAG: hypothetical protein R2880_15250 [Deinococcales bacterium]
MLALELWKVRSFFKEILKRPIQIFEGLLQTIGICSIEPVINCFQAGKFTTLLVVAKAFTCLFINLFTPSKTPVVNISTQASLIQELFFLGLVGLKFNSDGFVAILTWQAFPSMGKIALIILISHTKKGFPCKARYRALTEMCYHSPTLRMA